VADERGCTKTVKRGLSVKSTRGWYIRYRSRRLLRVIIMYYLVL
jgi:hypothetical protein